MAATTWQWEVKFAGVVEALLLKREDGKERSNESNDSSVANITPPSTVQPAAKVLTS